MIQTLKGHQGSVTCLASAYFEGTTFLASTSSDSTVIVWKRVGERFEKLETLQFGKKMMECCSMGIVNGNVILATGGLDNLIHVFQLESEKFVLKCKLAGHQDWIRCLDFKFFDDNLMLASGSQDNRIRLWKFEKESKQVIYQDTNWCVSFEALLSGHEEWVHTVKWHPTEEKLISSSMDRSMIIWRPDKTAGGVWINHARMGEFGGLSGLFGQLGFYGCHFSPDGTQVLAHGFNGSFHLWEEKLGWKPLISISGHHSDVLDLSWDSTGSYFMTVSLDQTVRLFSYYDTTKTWHEIARPQVHGYDINCMTVLNKTEHKIVSGADEKVLRVFEATQTFLDSLEKISGIKSDRTISRDVGASVPMLGLSNKGVTSEVKETDETTGFKPITLERPPYEEHLLQNTLWPETQKLYGHANEIYAMTCSNNGKWIASACKSKQAKESVILIWDTSSWTHVDTIKGHTLTVTQIQFSPDDRYLCSVGRDRTILLCELKDGKYQPKKQIEAGERIIWGVSWTFDGKYILTGSRDEHVRIFDTDLVKILDIDCQIPVTSVEFTPDSHIFAVGYENGTISFHDMKDKLFHTDQSVSACETIRRMKWRRTDSGYDLATCSTDHSIRLYKIQTPK